MLIISPAVVWPLFPQINTTTAIGPKHIQVPFSVPVVSLQFSVPMLLRGPRTDRGKRSSFADHNPATEVSEGLRMHVLAKVWDDQMAAAFKYIMPMLYYLGTQSRRSGIVRPPIERNLGTQQQRNGATNFGCRCAAHCNTIDRIRHPSGVEEVSLKNSRLAMHSK